MMGKVIGVRVKIYKDSGRGGIRESSEDFLIGEGDSGSNCQIAQALRKAEEYAQIKESQLPGCLVDMSCIWQKGS